VGLGERGLKEEWYCGWRLRSLFVSSACLFALSFFGLILSLSLGSRGEWKKTFLYVEKRGEEKKRQ